MQEDDDNDDIMFDGVDLDGFLSNSERFLKKRPEARTGYCNVPRRNDEHPKIEDTIGNPENFKETHPGLWTHDGEPSARLESLDNISIRTSKFSRGKSVSPYNEWKDPQDNMVGHWISRELLVTDHAHYFHDISTQLLNKIARRQRVVFQR